MPLVTANNVIIRLIACTERSVTQANMSAATRCIIYICIPKIFDYGSAVSMFWLCSVTMNGQILEISCRISVTQV